MTNAIYSGIYKKAPGKKTKLFIVDDNQLKIDSILIPFYLWETLAHNYMLAQNGLVPKADAKKILTAFIEYLEEYQKGSLKLNPEIGDIHENFEHLLSNKIGESAKWFHLARSRNDQIATDQKLVTKKLFFEFFSKALELTKTLGEKSLQNKDVVMPGFTHLRAAMPSSFGFWFQSYMDGLQEALMILQSIYVTVDKSPLGAGPSYGVNWKIYPESTAKNLGFDKTFNNALSAINARGIHEMYWLGTLSTFMTMVSRMMEDLMIFTLPELGYVLVDETYTTGSSIMPQKMNPDIIEGIRSKTSKFLAKFVELAACMKALPSGYNRDSALSKVIIIESFQEAIDIIGILTPMIATLIPNKEAMKEATTPTLATNLADYLVKKHNIPFRSAHKITGKALSLVNYNITKITEDIIKEASIEITGKQTIINDIEIKKILSPDNILESFSYEGTPNPTYVDKITNKLFKQNDTFTKWVRNQEAIFKIARNNLIKEVNKYLLQK